MAPPSPAPADRPVVGARHRERLGVPLRWWVQGTMLVASFWLALVVAIPGLLAWGLTAVALLVLGALLLSYGAVPVEVGDQGFRAGRAEVEGRYLGQVESLDSVGTRHAAGRDADVRALLVMRPYLSRAVKVEIVDPRDPTPYWLVSSRRPDDLAAALVALRRRGEGGGVRPRDAAR